MSANLTVDCSFVGIKRSSVDLEMRAARVATWFLIGGIVCSVIPFHSFRRLLTSFKYGQTLNEHILHTDASSAITAPRLSCFCPLETFEMSHPHCKLQPSIISTLSETLSAVHLPTSHRIACAHDTTEGVDIRTSEDIRRRGDWNVMKMASNVCVPSGLWCGW